jgi:hypothetical protein
VKPIIFWVWISLFLYGCSSISTQDVANTATAQVIKSDIATIVAGTQTAVALAPSPTHTKTPTFTPLSQAIATNEDLNDLFDTWTDSPSDDTSSLVREDLCFRDCISRIWTSGEGDATLEIALVFFPSTDEAINYLMSLKRNSEPQGLELLEVPEIVELWDESWISSDPDVPREFTIHTRQGAVMQTITLSIPWLDTEQNLLFLSLYAERQTQKLERSGY